ncbi:MAG: hypothetical protein QGH83_15580 [Candidatus Pacebacteria bacterium]|jgi:hypothetical protein|nr:hypothetical protein [Candidatus Paceibacterota bacterium]|tara:strand:- start:615 stop:935 length:321 start_codon:yes stop_codon:yes gene_type:complete
MAYIGRGIEIGAFAKTSITTGNGVLTAFDVLKWNVSQNSLLVVYGGVIQEPGVSYVVSNTTITFSSAPASGTTLYIIYLGKELTSIANPTTAEVSDEAAAMALALG